MTIMKMMINKQFYHNHDHSNHHVNRWNCKNCICWHNLASLKVPVLMVVMLILSDTSSSIQIESIEMMATNTNDLDRSSPSIQQSTSSDESIRMAECHLRPVIHILQRSGCVPKPIPSFACYGTCNSYVQVSNSKFWQVERSCNCCQEIGEREANIMLYCPRHTPNYRKVTTRAPVECLCRPCTAVDEHQIQAMEMHHSRSHNNHHQASQRKRRG